MKKASLLFLLSIAIIILSGCGSQDPVPITAVSEITGNWKGTGQIMAMKIFPDGSVLQATLMAKIDSGEFEELGFIFEGNQITVTGLESYCEAEVGLYQAQLLPSGNLVFIVVNDDCEHRGHHLLALGDKNEWTRVE